MPLIPTKLLALAPVILLSSAASASPATHVVHEAAHTRTASASAAPHTAPVATTPMLADDGCPLPGNVGKGGDAHDRCELRRAQAIADGQVARK
jgi:hypothetical protein